MADMHVLTGAGRRWTVAMHFTVPNTNNSVGVNFRTALAASGIGRQVNADGSLGRRSILASGTGAGEITTAEEALLDSGQLFEHVAAFLVESDGTAPAKLRTTLREFFATENATAQARIGERLKYFGHTESSV